MPTFANQAEESALAIHAKPHTVKWKCFFHPRKGGVKSLTETAKEIPIGSLSCHSPAHWLSDPNTYCWSCLWLMDDLKLLETSVHGTNLRTLRTWLKLMWKNPSLPTLTLDLNVHPRLGLLGPKPGTFGHGTLFRMRNPFLGLLISFSPGFSLRKNSIFETYSSQWPMWNQCAMRLFTAAPKEPLRVKTAYIVMLPTLTLYFTFCGVTRFHDSKLLTYVVVPTDDEWRINFTRKRFNFEEKQTFSFRKYYTFRRFSLNSRRSQLKIFLTQANFKPKL